MPKHTTLVVSLQLKRNLRSRKNPRVAMSHEISNYGIVQKDPRGLDMAVETAVWRMSRYSVKPDVIFGTSNQWLDFGLKLLDLYF